VASAGKRARSITVAGAAAGAGVAGAASPPSDDTGAADERKAKRARRPAPMARKPKRRPAASVTRAVCPATLIGGSSGVPGLGKGRGGGPQRDATDGADPVIAWLAEQHAAAAAARRAGEPASPDDEDAELLGMGMELEHWSDGFTVVGVDEAGRGPLCGPVVSAAVSVEPLAWAEAGEDASTAGEREPVPGVTDSKALSEAEREHLAAALIRHPRVTWAVAVAGPRAIEEHNILRASLDSMTVAADDVADQAMPQETRDTPEPWTRGRIHVLVDGNRMPPAFRGREEAAARAESGFRFGASTLVKGDTRCYSIAAASVLAKVVRDRIMARLDELYPGYGMAGHKGYPTPAHMAVVRSKGASDCHRLTFAPLKGHWERDADGHAVPAGSGSESESE